jgi:type III secretory pathway component EscV
MATCSGPIYNSYDYAALHAKLNHDELVRLNETMDHLSGVQNLELNKDLKETIEKRFQELPHDVLLSAEVQNLRKSLLEYVDERVPPRTLPTVPRPQRPPTKPTPRPGATTP